MREIVGTDGEFTADEISYQIRNVIVQEFSRALAASGIPALDMAANTKDMGDLVAKAIDATMTAYGITIPELYIENISLPEAVEKALDARTSRGIAGNLDEHMKWKAAEAMTQPGSAAGQAMGMGMGAGLGMQMGNMVQSGPWGQMPQPSVAAAAPPPPPPVEHVWHIAIAGQTTGPFSKAAMGRKVTEGALDRDTMVWTQGQDGWKPAVNTELAQLFTDRRRKRVGQIRDRLVHGAVAGGFGAGHGIDHL
jgi:hypothetical protein